MKEINVILVLALLFFTNCSNQGKPCIKKIPEWCATAKISKEYDPVCGCDGKTYQNSAHAECVGGITNYKKGKCE